MALGYDVDCNAHSAFGIALGNSEELPESVRNHSTRKQGMTIVFICLGGSFILAGFAREVVGPLISRVARWWAVL